MNLELPQVFPGDPIEAWHLTVLYQALRKLQLVVGLNGGLTMSIGDTGITLGMENNDGFWIKLTSNSGNSYAWTQQIPQASGTWADGYESGTTSADPAHESNGNTSPPTLPKIVWARREPASNEVVFQIGSC